MHRFDPASARFVEALRDECANDPRFRAPAESPAQFDAETVASRYLQKALSSDSVPDLTRAPADGVDSQFNRLGTETILLSGTRVVKFRQTYNSIPVYGSLVSIEVDEQNELIALNSSLGQPKGVNPIARISPLEALTRIKKYGGYRKDLSRAIPLLHYYFDSQRSKPGWCLAYIVHDVPVRRHVKKKKALTRGCMDYFVDAQRGKVLAEWPRTSYIAPIEETAEDGLNVLRRFKVEMDSRQRVLRNSDLNVQTFNFHFKDPVTQRNLLPGRAINNPPNPWPPEAISAQANAEVVARFLLDVVRRNSIDNQGGPIYSSVNCVDKSVGDPPRQWVNAFWTGTQMVYGQKRLGKEKELVSLAVDLDIVGHELFHGITGLTARMELKGQTGALNESYSDIFGVIINNVRRPDVRDWSWEIGKGFDDDQAAFRDLQDPVRRGHPKHVDDFIHEPNDEDHDFGQIHANSCIHSHAAYLILNAVDGEGDPVLGTLEVAAVFYIALTQYLSRRSRFRDSRRAVLLAAQTLFRHLSEAERTLKLAAISQGFDAVGID